MWIRSQCKMYLINLALNDLYIIGNQLRVRSPSDKDTYIIIGQYESMSRAIEILDQIEITAKLTNKIIQMPIK